MLVQDYHLSLVPRMLRERLGGTAREVPIAHFCHIPWAPPDYYRILPLEVGRAVLDGILGADHAGFHAVRWATAFLDCCAAILGADVDRTGTEGTGPEGTGSAGTGPAGTSVAGTVGRVTYRGHVTEVAVHPLGVENAAALRARAGADDVRAQHQHARPGRGQEKADRPGRPDRAVQEHRAGPDRLPRAARHPAAVAGARHAPGLCLPVPVGGAGVPCLHRASPAAGAGDLRGVRHGGLEPADPGGEGRLPPVACRVRSRRRAGGEPDQGRHEPGRPGGAGAFPARLRPGAVPGGAWPPPRSPPTRC